MEAPDFSNLDEVAFDQGIDKVYVIGRQTQHRNRQLAAERGDRLTMIAGISAGR